MSKNKSCGFIGHRKIEGTPKLKKVLIDIIADSIINNNVDTFFLGSKSQFNDLCKNILITLKRKYPHIKIVYVRAEYQYINDEYKKYLLETYDDTYFPKQLIGAGKSIYVKRNYEMIDKSNYCIIYFNKDYALSTKTNFTQNLHTYQRKSGTKIVYDYAVKKGCVVKNLYNQLDV